MASLVRLVNKFNSLNNQISTWTNPSNRQKYVIWKKIRCQSLHTTPKLQKKLSDRRNWREPFLQKLSACLNKFLCFVFKKCFLIFKTENIFFFSAETYLVDFKCFGNWKKQPKKKAPCWPPRVAATTPRLWGVEAATHSLEGVGSPPLRFWCPPPQKAWSWWKTHPSCQSPPHRRPLRVDLHPCKGGRWEVMCYEGDFTFLTEGSRPSPPSPSAGQKFHHPTPLRGGDRPPPPSTCRGPLHLHAPLFTTAAWEHVFLKQFFIFWKRFSKHRYMKNLEGVFLFFF